MFNCMGAQINMFSLNRMVGNLSYVFLLFHLPLSHFASLGISDRVTELGDPCADRTKFNH